MTGSLLYEMGEGGGRCPPPSPINTIEGTVIGDGSADRRRSEEPSPAMRDELTESNLARGNSYLWDYR